MHIEEQRFRHSPNAVSSEVLDEMVIYCPATSQALSLNESARAIWELCDGTRSVNDICAELARTVGGEPADLRGDVDAAISRLRDLGVLLPASS
jgi:hypothetical protein